MEKVEVLTLELLMFELHVKSDHILVKLMSVSKHEVCVKRRLILLTLSFSTGSKRLRPRHILFCERSRCGLEDLSCLSSARCTRSESLRESTMNPISLSIAEQCMLFLVYLRK